MTVSEGWKRLHPASLAVNLIPRSLRFARAFWPILLVMIFGGGNRQVVLDGSLLLAFFLVPLSQTIVHFLTLRYRVWNGRLEIESGLLNRQARAIDPERVQNVELVRNLFQRLAGLVEVRIETASGTEVEGMLSALREEEAALLVEALRDGQRDRTEETAPVEEAPLVIANNPSELVRYGITVTRVGAAILIVWGLAMEGLQLLDPGDVDDAAGMFEGIGAVALMAAVLTGGLLAGVVGAMTRHWNFQLRDVEDRLVATEGLFTRRQVQLRRSRIQLISVEEPVLRRLMGFGSVHIETAAVRAGAGGLESAEAMVPVVERQQISRIVRAALPDFAIDLERVALQPPHPRALIRNLIRSCTQTSLLAAAIAWFAWPWGLLALLLPLLGAGATIMDHRYQGWLVTDQYVISRRGWLRRSTLIVARRKLQVLSAVQGPLLRRYGLGRLVLRVPGGVISLPMLSWEDVGELLQTLTPRGLRHTGSRL